MELVAAGFCDGVDDAAGGAAELSRVAYRGGLELRDGVDREDVGRADGTAAGFREELLIVVGAIDDVGVVDAGDAAIGEQAGGAVGDDVGRGEHEAVETAAADGQVGDERLIDDGGAFDLFGVDQGRLGGDGDLGGDAGGGQRCIHGDGGADADGNVLAIDLAEGAAAEDDLIGSGLQEAGLIVAFGVRGQRARGSGLRVGDDHGDTRNDRAGGIANDAGDAPSAAVCAEAGARAAPSSRPEATRERSDWTKAT